MKRNESILVYSVTGLLVVILLVAVVFGNGNPADAKAPDGGRKVVALDDLDGMTRGARTAEDGHEPGDGGEATNPGAESGNGDGAGVVVPLVSNGSGAQAQPAVEPAPAPAPELELGASERQGDYRVVTVTSGDTFSSLVQHWCGSLDRLAEAEALNETANLSRLKVGTRLWLPWVDDAALVEAIHARTRSVQEPERPLLNAQQAAATYTIKAGDKLWDIAVARVGANKARQFIDAVVALNPTVLRDPDRLKPGQEIRLPH